MDETDDKYDFEIVANKDETKPKQNKKRKLKKNLSSRRGRIIVRNIPFKVKEDKLKTHFAKYGNVTDVNILKRPDGKLVGCAFVQFEVVQNAAKAIYHTTGKPFMGRTIVCDWALGKDSYLKNMLEEYKREKESEVVEIKDEVKDEKLSDGENDTKDEVKVEEVSDDNEKENDDDQKSSEDNSDDDNPSDDDDGDDGDDDEDSEESESEDEEDEPVTKKPRVESNDVVEGKTVFIKNIPFSATKEDLEQCMSQFGPMFYALICVDRDTEHSKGTAFVKFKSKEDADKCLAAGTELTLKGNILDCHIALNRKDIQNKSSDSKKDQKKDSRNLYLIKEGVILAGSKSATGVSASDMARRLELEKWKTQMLRNLNMFISRYRLIIHNLPLTWDDQKLRMLFAKHAGPDAVIKEARVMRNMKQLDAKGVGTSKGHGFVSFSMHEHALRALRALNNNPNIFTPTKRPIVAFSIENKAVINVKNRRLQKSRMHNPCAKEWDPAAVKLAQEQKGSTRSTSSKNTKNTNNNKQQQQASGDDPGFSGVAARPGAPHKMRSRYKLKTQAQLHFQNLKKEKKRRRHMQNSMQLRRDKTRQPKQKQSTNQKPQHQDKFSKLEQRYKKQMAAEPATQKTKWYL